MLFRLTPMFRKTDIINYLAEARGYDKYLEICTSITGNEYSRIDRSLFSTCHRLMYRCPNDFNDDLPIDFRSDSCGLDEAGCFPAILSQGRLYDVILVDPWHEYETSIRDLAFASAILAEGGTIVVHDCLPPSAKIASPQFCPGYWSGLTYKAFIDFVLSRRDLNYFTVNTDFGCGIIRKIGTSTGNASDCSLASFEREKLVDSWHHFSERQDFKLTYRFFWKNRKELLNLVSVNAFKDLESRHAKSLAASSWT